MECLNNNITCMLCTVEAKKSKMLVTLQKKKKNLNFYIRKMSLQVEVRL